MEWVSLLSTNKLDKEVAGPGDWANYPVSEQRKRTEVSAAVYQRSFSRQDIAYAAADLENVLHSENLLGILSADMIITGQNKQKSLVPTGHKAFSMAAGEGFEPSHTESESAVLPLHNPATFITNNSIIHISPDLSRGNFKSSL